MNTSDQSLMDAIARGDRATFECVYRAHKDDLLTVSAMILRERSLAEDVLHDVFVNLSRIAGEIRLTGTLRNYLITSCLNRARDVIVKRNRELPVTPCIDDVAQHASDPGQSLANDEELVQLNAAIQLLPTAQREVVTLHIHGRLKFREIAEFLEISTNTAQSRYRYALNKLRHILTESHSQNEG
ncbi:ECF RNA polymerase sigma factor SigM [Symmachiella macrocystis]|uniref:ECF RNA polymerase sigma factor SigM n=2 Tax=Symmachiella macrocystis TaxID=2527985 RepID=A0A5C6BEH6_9PLAN|nr:ECF RNA polymerase sigma factor SigM [Symmachiella macrocystis]